MIFRSNRVWSGLLTISKRYYALAYSENVSPLSPKFVLHVGGQWAKQAQRLILETLEIVTIDNLMVSIVASQFTPPG
jgi:hypothetical protein